MMNCFRKNICFTCFLRYFQADKTNSSHQLILSPLRVTPNSGSDSLILLLPVSWQAIPVFCDVCVFLYPPFSS